MFDVLKSGGKTALEFLGNSSPTLKPDNSVLTKADLAVSALARERLKDVLSQPGHILIDEEDQQSSRYFDAQKLACTKYIWTLDPIDGTRAFANQIPLFGISIGIFKDLKPWMGAVLLPVLGELFYCDGEEAFFVRNAFTAAEKRTPIKPVDQEITRQSVFFGNDAFFQDYDWNFAFCQMMLPSCAVIDFCWPSIGRGAGCMFNSYIWDFGGAWPIARAAGLDIRSIKTGQKISQLSLDIFQGKGALTWRLKENLLLSSSRNFPLIVENGLRAKQK